MHIYLHLQSDKELICYEAMALSFVLASFEHLVQVHLTGDALEVLCDPKSRLYGMAQSLTLYDMPPLWLDDLSPLAQLPALHSVCQPTPSDYLSLVAAADSKLNF